MRTQGYNYSLVLLCAHVIRVLRMDYAGIAARGVRFIGKNQGNRLTTRERHRLVKPSSTVDVEFAYTGALGGAPVYCTALRDSLTANNSIPSISGIYACPRYFNTCFLIVTSRFPRFPRGKEIFSNVSKRHYV